MRLPQPPIIQEKGLPLRDNPLKFILKSLFDVYASKYNSVRFVNYFSVFEDNKTRKHINYYEQIVALSVADNCWM